MTSLSSDVEKFRNILSSSKNIIILSGAGLSAPSGIPTYRGSSSSVWTKNDSAKLSTPQGFEDDPSKVWQFHHHRRVGYLRAKPNDAHKALATLNVPSVLSRIAPSVSVPILHVTQNVDGLSLQALKNLPSNIRASEESQIIEMHGSIFQTRCTSCQHKKRSQELSLASSLDSTVEDDITPDIPVEKLPRCGGETWSGSNRFGKCGSLLRPDVVWFGEVPPLMGEISRKMSRCDLLLVVGTSSLVYPAAGFASQVKANRGKVAVFNLERSNNDDNADFLFLGSCDATLPVTLGVKDDILQIYEAE